MPPNQLLIEHTMEKQLVNTHGNEVSELLYQDCFLSVTK